MRRQCSFYVLIVGKWWWPRTWAMQRQWQWTPRIWMIQDTTRQICGNQLNAFRKWLFDWWTLKINYQLIDLAPNIQNEFQPHLGNERCSYRIEMHAIAWSSIKTRAWLTNTNGFHKSNNRYDCVSCSLVDDCSNNSIHFIVLAVSHTRPALALVRIKIKCN